ncbi:MAG: MerR family transcriptional regulator [Acidimicrobiaceae bacterium]|nr:MerR family transcriptional regulator [Acidimicrobiaceae bacterium]
MNIGDVVIVLEPEFPDVTVSKLRFLEAEGLVRPARSASGYRYYEEEDVARVIRVLRLQRDRHLPLKVIASMLDEGNPTEAQGDGGVDVPAFRERVGRRGRSTDGGALSGSVSVSLAELAVMVGLDEDTVSELERLGLVRGHEAGSSTVYDDEAVLVGRVAACFVDHGFDVRHLRMYLVAAQREAGLLEQLVGPVAGGGGSWGRGSPGSVDSTHGRSLIEARQLVDELTDAGSALHELLVRRELGTVGR